MTFGRDLMPSLVTPYSTFHDWTFEILYGGNEYALTHWLDASITENFDNVTMSINTYAMAPELKYVVELVTDIVCKRDGVLVYRLRVASIQNAYMPDNHTVSITCVGYEDLLNRRILVTDLDATRDQHAWAVWLIDYTQTRYSLGITTTGVANSGQNRQRKIRNGTVIHDAINDIAASENGFDWWIDQNRQLHCQTPRRERTWNWEWSWGVQLSSIDRESPIGNYASGVLVVGATSETTLPGGTTYPPPQPVYAKAQTFPRGLWEKAYSYSDIVTTASVTEKAKWHLTDSFKLRPSYKVTVEPGIWHPDIQIGDRFWLRIDDPREDVPVHDVRARVRIEEVSIELTADGAENVTMAIRAETEETIVPTLTTAVAALEIQPLSGDEVVVPDSTPPTGRSAASAYTSEAREFSAILLGLQDRMKRVERPWEITGGDGGTGGGGGHTIQDEGVSLAARAQLDFRGAGVVATDDSINGKTVVTIPGGAITDVVWQGPEAPTDPATELWWDTDAPTPSAQVPIVVKATEPTAADYGQASIPLDAIWIQKPA